MTHDTIPPFAFPAVWGRKITAEFDGGRLTSDGGVMILAMAERRLGIAARLAPDRRDPARVTHALADMIRARIFAIAMGYEDADDLDHLRRDPVFKLACGCLPDSGDGLCSQPTLSRLENAPGLRDVIRRRGHQPSFRLGAVALRQPVLRVRPRRKLIKRGNARVTAPSPIRSEEAYQDALRRASSLIEKSDKVATAHLDVLEVSIER